MSFAIGQKHHAHVVNVDRWISRNAERSVLENPSATCCPPQMRPSPGMKVVRTLRAECQNDRSFNVVDGTGLSSASHHSTPQISDHDDRKTPMIRRGLGPLWQA
nr:hypothetical protein CFP56_03955 [Quercus suber]